MCYPWDLGCILTAAINGFAGVIFSGIASIFLGLESLLIMAVGGEQTFWTFLLYVPVACNNGASTASAPGAALLPACATYPNPWSSTGVPIPVGSFMGATMTNLYWLVEQGSVYLLLILLIFAGLSYVLESFSVMREGTAMSIMSGSIFALILIFIAPLLYSGTAMIINYVVSDPGPILNLSGYTLPPNTGPITLLMKASVNPCALAVSGQQAACLGAAFNTSSSLAAAFFSIVFFVTGITTMITIVAGGIIRMLLIGTIFVMMPLLLLLRLLPFTKSTADGLIDTLMGLMLTSVLIAIFVEFGFTVVFNQVQDLIAGGTNNWGFAVIAIASFATLTGGTFMTMIAAPRAGKMIGKTSDIVRGGVETASMGMMMAGVGAAAGAMGAMGGLGGLAGGGGAAGGAAGAMGAMQAGGGAAAAMGSMGGRVVGEGSIMGGLKGGLGHAGFVMKHTALGAFHGGAQGMMGGGSLVGAPGAAVGAFGAHFGRGSAAGAARRSSILSKNWLAAEGNHATSGRLQEAVMNNKLDATKMGGVEKALGGSYMAGGAAEAWNESEVRLKHAQATQPGANPAMSPINRMASDKRLDQFAHMSDQQIVQEKANAGLLDPAKLQHKDYMAAQLKQAADDRGMIQSNLAKVRNASNSLDERAQAAAVLGMYKNNWNYGKDHIHQHPKMEHFT